MYLCKVDTNFLKNYNNLVLNYKIPSSEICLFIIGIWYNCFVEQWLWTEVGLHRDLKFSIFSKTIENSVCELKKNIIIGINYVHL